MSQTASTETVPLSIFEKLGRYGAGSLTAVEHAAVRLVGEVANSDLSLQALNASSPWVHAAWEAGQASALAHGIPLVPVENELESVLAAAKRFVAGLQQPAPTPPLAA